MASASFSRAGSRSADGLTSLRSNFAEPKLSSSTARLSIDYNHETYLQLTASNKAAAKTANQIYLEERAQRLHLRSQDPAISGPQSGPSSMDFECVENQLKRDATYARQMSHNKGARQ